jgi:hypothetical protein
MGPIHWIHGWGFPYGIYPWGSALVMEDFDGETFLGGLLIFFLGGGGRGRGTPGSVQLRRFRRTTRVPNSPVYVIYYILHSGGFAAACARQSRTVTPILDTLDRQVHCFRTRQPVDQVHALKTVKGLLLLVPSRTPRRSGYDVICTCDTVVYTVRGVGSGSRDVDAWRTNGCTPRIGGSKYR